MILWIVFVIWLRIFHVSYLRWRWLCCRNCSAAFLEWQIYGDNVAFIA